MLTVSPVALLFLLFFFFYIQLKENKPAGTFHILPEKKKQTSELYQIFIMYIFGTMNSTAPGEKWSEQSAQRAGSEGVHFVENLKVILELIKNHCSLYYHH